MVFEPLHLSAQGQRNAPARSNQSALPRFNSLAEALGAARRQTGPSKILLDDQGAYHLVKADSFKRVSAAYGQGTIDAAVAVKLSGEPVIRVDDLGKSSAQLVHLLLQGDHRLDEQELQFLANHLTGRLTGEQSREFVDFREALVEALSRKQAGGNWGPSTFDALIARVLRPNASHADMAILNLVAASSQGSVMVGEQLESFKTQAGLLNPYGKILVERLLATEAGSTLLCSMVKDALAEDTEEGLALLRTLSGSEAGRRFFLQQLASLEGVANPFASGVLVKHPRPVAKQYLSLLQSTVPNLLRELCDPQQGFFDQGHKLTHAGQQLISLLDEGSKLRGDLEILRLGAHFPLRREDERALKGMAATSAGRARLDALLEHFSPEVGRFVRDEVDGEVRKRLLTEVADKLKSSKYWKGLKWRKGQLNRCGPDIDCYDAAWDITSAVERVRDAVKSGMHQPVPGLYFPSRQYKNFQSFVEQLRVGDVLHLGPPGQHWMVYIGKDQSGVPQVMHGNWGFRQFLPDGAGDTVRLPGEKVLNKDMSLVITGIQDATRFYMNHVQAVYHPLEK